MSNATRSSGALIAERLAAHGVVFEHGLPCRAHHQAHGQERDTFLVLENRWGELTTLVDARYGGRKYVECMLDGPADALARSRLYVYRDEDGSGYGDRIMISMKHIAVHPWPANLLLIIDAEQRTRG